VKKLLTGEEGLLNEAEILDLGEEVAMEAILSVETEMEDEMGARIIDLDLAVVHLETQIIDLHLNRVSQEEVLVLSQEEIQAAIIILSIETTQAVVEIITQAPHLEIGVVIRPQTRFQGQEVLLEEGIIEATILLARIIMEEVGLTLIPPITLFKEEEGLAPQMCLGPVDLQTTLSVQVVPLLEMSSQNPQPLLSKQTIALGMCLVVTAIPQLIETLFQVLQSTQPIKKEWTSITNSKMTHFAFQSLLLNDSMT